MTGAKFSFCEVTLSPELETAVGKVILPRYWRLEPVGKMANDDYCLDEKHRLVISGRAKILLESFAVSDCDFQIM